MNLLLVDDRLRDAHVFVDSVNEATCAIRYTPDMNLIEEIQKKGQAFERIAIAFTKDRPFLDKSFMEQEPLFLSIISTFQVKRIDFLACDTLNDPLWSEFYAKLPVVVGASNDKTGNLKYGGDWVMESTGQDIEAVYFTQSIGYYQYLLDYPGGNNMIVLKDDGKVWVSGFNGNSQITNNNQYIPNFTPITTNIEPSTVIFANGQSNYWIVDNKLYGLGSLYNTVTEIAVPVSSPGTLQKVVAHFNVNGMAILLDGKTYLKNTLLQGWGAMDTYYGSFTLLDILDASGNSIVVTDIWGGAGHFVALAGGELYGIGQGDVGQIGVSNNTRTWQKIDFPVGETGALTQVAVGGNNTFIIMGGNLYGIGNNGYVESRLFSPPWDGTTRVFKRAKFSGGDTTGVTFVAAGEFAVFFVMNNLVYRSTRESFPTVLPLPAGVTGPVTSMSVGVNHMVMSIGGKIYGYGRNNYYELGKDLLTLEFTAGMYLSKMVTTISEITNKGQEILNVSQVVAGNNCTLAVINGVLHGMGENVGDGNYSNINDSISGQLGIQRKMVQTTLTPIQKDGVDLVGVTKAIIGSDNLMLVHEGKVYLRGNNYKGLLGLPYTEASYRVQQIPDLTEAVFPAGASGPIQHIAGGPISIVVRGGKIYGAGNWYSVSTLPTINFVEMPLPAGVTGNIEAVSCGADHAVFLIGGKLYGMGNNRDYGSYSVGGNDTVARNTITSFDSTNFTASNVTHLSCGSYFTVFVMNNEIYTSGSAIGQYIGGNCVKIPFPSGVPTTTTIDSISAGDRHIAVIFGGKLYGQFSNDAGQIKTLVGQQDEQRQNWYHMVYNGVPITNATMVRCSGGYTTAVWGGKLYGRGNNDYFKLSPTNGGWNRDWVLIAEGLAGLSATVETIVPNSGTTNTQVTVTGTVLNSITSVVLDTNNTTYISANAVTLTIVPGRSATSISFTIPAGDGSKWIKLISADKNYVAGSFVYRNPIQITSLSSYTGTKNKILNIKATDMTNLARIKFNGVATTAFNQISPTEYTVIVPDSTSGTVVLEDIFNVTSIPPISFTYQNATLTNGYVNSEAPSASATITGKAGDTLTLMGTFLGDTKQVYFGNTPGTIVGTPTSVSVVVTVPVELGTVSIRIYDKDLNLTTCTKQFVYQLEAVQAGAVAAVVQGSAIDASGQKYYSVLKNSRYYIVKYVNETTSTDLYDNGVNPIRGIACTGTTIYFCDPSNTRIQLISSTTTTMLTVATPVLTRATMIPEAIKTNGTKLWIVCTNSDVPTNDALVIMDGANITAQTYALFPGYSLQGITYNPNGTDTNLYISAVVWANSAKVLTTGTGRVFRTTAEGASPELAFIQNITNPIDLTFANGYLIVDGIIRLYDTSGNLVISLDTNANTILPEALSQDVNIVEQTVTFTSVNSVTGTTTVNQFSVPPYIPNVFQLTQTYNPQSGPEGTVVSIVGYNMTAADITQVKIRDASGTQIDPYVFTVSSNLLVIRMPKKDELVGTEMTIVVTLATGPPQEYAYSYKAPDLVNIIPLFKNDVRYFRFTGHNLQNIQYVDFVDTSTNDTRPANQLTVRDVTATSFHCDFVTVPMNTTRCLLKDAFGNVTIEDANYFSLSSETCFLGGTPVMTDQGEVPIDKIDCTYHTIDQREIVAITKTRYNKDTLILLEKDSLKKNYPTQDTVITHKHKIYFKGKMKKAESFVGKRDGVRVVPYKNQFLYNVLLKTHEVMRVNGLVCETLYPKNPIAQFFTPDQESIHAESCD